MRSVRGAPSAALAAREFGLKSLAVPEANAKEAAVVEGVDVFALKSLPQAVDLINSPESFTPVKVDAQQMLSEAAQYFVDLRDVHGQHCQPGLRPLLLLALLEIPSVGNDVKWTSFAFLEDPAHIFTENADGNHESCIA